MIACTGDIFRQRFKSSAEIIFGRDNFRHHSLQTALQLEGALHYAHYALHYALLRGACPPKPSILPFYCLRSPPYCPSIAFSMPSNWRAVRTMMLKFCHYPPKMPFEAPQNALLFIQNSCPSFKFSNFGDYVRHHFCQISALISAEM